jgi:hypothetical protein
MNIDLEGQECSFRVKILKLAVAIQNFKRRRWGFG